MRRSPTGKRHVREDHDEQRQSSAAGRPGTASSARDAAPPLHPLLSLQQEAGNQIVVGLLQAKLEVGSADDRAEREADAVADQVMRFLAGGPSAGARVEPGSAQPTGRSPAQRAVQPEETATSTVGADGGALDPDTEGALTTGRGRGRGLDESVRRSMEGAFGADFSGVRVHDDADAHQVSDTIQAKAFTLGSDIYFRRDAYHPTSPAGRRLLAHELTHVIQQDRAVVRTTPEPPAHAREEPLASISGAPVARRVQRRPAGIGAEGGALDADTERSLAPARSGGRPLDTALSRIRPMTFRMPASMRSAQGKIRRRDAGFEPLQRRLHQDVIQRELLDKDYEDDVFDVAAGKRDAELANMRLGSKGIGPTDPRRQSLETFFQDPAHQKGSRSRAAKGPGPGRRDPAAAPRGNVKQTTLPEVLVAGPDASISPRLPEQAAAESKLQEIVDDILLKNPALAAIIGPLQTAALAQVGAMGQNKISKITHGAGQAGDSAMLTASVTNIVEQFRKDVDREVERAAWEGSVRARAAFVNSKANPEMAERALDRAKQAIPFATDIYDKLYEVVGFAEPAISEISKASCEQRLLDLCGVVPPGEWSALLVAVTKSASLLAFALGHHASLAGVADTAAVARVWHANDTAITSVAQCQTILALHLVHGNALIAVKAARLLGTPQVPDVAALTALDAGGLFASITDIASLTKLGGDLAANMAMRALPTAPKDTEIEAFNLKAGTTPVEAAASWTLLTANVADDLKKHQIIRSLAVAPNATRTDFERLVTNYAALMDRGQIVGKTVALLVGSGILQAQGKLYSSGTWGPGCVYVFRLAGQGRLTPEWHIHFKSAGGKREALVAGAGWKDADEKYGCGVKTFGGSEPKLVESLRNAGAWKSTMF